MKKFTILVTSFFLEIMAINAKPVSVNTAQNVATNFFSQTSHLKITETTLAYTATVSSGLPLYYVFNINTTDGFVIISADDALYPIIGYSTEKSPYIIPATGTTIDYWMQKRKTEIINDVSNGVKATQDISNQWTSCINNTPLTSANNQRIMQSGMFPSNTAYLVQSKWGQASPYQNDCPGTGSSKALTGCVATSMCQIMRYWQYPAYGQGSCTYYSSYYADSLSANFNHSYNWSAMPLTSPNGSDTDLMRVCRMQV